MRKNRRIPRDRMKTWIQKILNFPGVLTKPPGPREKPDFPGIIPGKPGGLVSMHVHDIVLQYSSTAVVQSLER